jgi:hypothetical protein
MASVLAPCPSCSRHVKVGPAVCPFCGGEVPTEVAPRTLTIGAGRPLTRAALMFAGAAALGACSSSSSGPPLEGTLDAAYGVAIGPPDATHDGEFVTHYGVVAVPMDAGSDAEHGTLDAAYGIAIGPPDAQDVTQPMASYGVAIIPDASGVDAPASFDAAYGVFVGDAGTK